MCRSSSSQSAEGSSPSRNDERAAKTDSHSDSFISSPSHRHPATFLVRGGRDAGAASAHLRLLPRRGRWLLSTTPRCRAAETPFGTFLVVAESHSLMPDGARYPLPDRREARTNPRFRDPRHFLGVSIDPGYQKPS